MIVVYKCISSNAANKQKKTNGQSHETTLIFVSKVTIEPNAAFHAALTASFYGRALNCPCLLEIIKADTNRLEGRRFQNSLNDSDLDVVAQQEVGHNVHHSGIARLLQTEPVHVPAQHPQGIFARQLISIYHRFQGRKNQSNQNTNPNANASGKRREATSCRLFRFFKVSSFGITWKRSRILVHIK